MALARDSCAIAYRCGVRDTKSILVSSSNLDDSEDTKTPYEFQLKRQF